METAAQKLLTIMPLLFGLGFIAPLLLQTGLAGAAADRFGADPLWLSLALGGGWGLFATIRGRWL